MTMKISPQEFSQFSSFFYDRTGIFFDESKRYFVDKRLIDRMRATNCHDVKTYLTHVGRKASAQEMQALTNSMTVNETYFFREAYQFDCLVSSMLAEVAPRKRPGETIKIWSLPCSSGEEPYSIVLYLLEYWPEISIYDVEIFGSDIDTGILASAERGLFSRRSVQNLSPDLLQRYFQRADGDRWQLNTDIRQSVSFSHVNILDPGDLARFSGIDVIFCRNLLIYFDEISRRAAAEALHGCLAPGGFLCLGHSESMSRISNLFQVRRLPEATVYQRPR
ncbi:chemotaxis protein methyltransferase CheR [Rhizobium sp. RU35A]|uniref:CheR family methyltransferase n=1 Tax=Rhizobium sp. RU35A TaxID=1907414 RepID=UPI0009553ACC|nr:protein-glutamate O-methyltransferase CheR [Rhizobium sp. RU35A]SIQ31307.1 chemotaxis protein methyltransferase CheR [Rhizobium sp. RU35A]